MMRIAVLISGRGSNLKAIIEDTKKEGCPYLIELVIADKKCDGLRYASEEEIPTSIIDYSAFADRKSAEKVINDLLNMKNIELVVLAGYMKLLTPYLVNRWKNRIINIHPALLPSFPGLNTHERAIQAGVKYHGVTVHFVDEGIDSGPIIDQLVVPVFRDDTPDLLASRVLVEEHKLLPDVIRRLVQSGDK